MNKKFAISKKTIIDIMRSVSEKVQILCKFQKDFDIYLSRKNVSEILGKVMEKVASDIFTLEMGYEVRKAKNDNDPDLYFSKINLPVEIKVTGTDKSWTGGEFSKRPYNYFLVSWGGESINEFFVCFLHLVKSDWKSNISKKFYGPSLSIKHVYNIPKKTIIIGKIKKTKNGAVKLFRENIDRAYKQSKLFKQN